MNLDVRDHKGRTALYLATERGSTECVEVLTSHGASALVKERKRKWTPLHAAGDGGQTGLGVARGCVQSPSSRRCHRCQGRPFTWLLFGEREGAVVSDDAWSQDGASAACCDVPAEAEGPSGSAAGGREDTSGFCTHVSSAQPVHVLISPVA